jgi:hypothetical protein
MDKHLTVCPGVSMMIFLRPLQQSAGDQAVG